MSSDFWSKMSNIAANTRPIETSQLPTATPPYSFTEVINIHWSSPPNLDNTSTEESQIWSKTLSAYSKHTGTGRLWWGQLIDAPQHMKLAIDWKSVEHRNDFHASQGMASLLENWKASPTPINTHTPKFFIFPSMQGYRQNAFQPPDSYFKEAVTVFATFHLPADWSPDATDEDDKLTRSKVSVWNDAWSDFQNAALKSEGAWIADKALKGWSIGATPTQNAGPGYEEKAFMSVFRFQDASTAKDFVRATETEQPNGLAKLKRIAERGMNVEAVNMEFESSLDG